MSRVKIEFYAPSKRNGFYPLPAIYCWINDFTCIELRDIMGFKSYGVSLNIFKWQMGCGINIKPKTYNDNNKCSSSQ